MSGNSSRRLLLFLFFGRHSFRTGAFAVLLLSCTASLAGSITPGNLVIVRAAGGPNGDATQALAGGGVAATAWLDEYTKAGVYVQSFKAPNVRNTTQGSQRALTLSGAANTEGLLTLSGNGQYFVLGGYNQTATAVGTNASPSYNEVNPGTTAPFERVAGRMDFNGNWDTSTTFIDAMSAQSIRSAYSIDGINFYVTGNGGNNVTVNGVANNLTSGVHLGVLGVNTGGTILSTQLNTAGLTGNNRQVLASGGALYVSSMGTSSNGAPARGVDIMDGGIATTTGQILRSMTGFPTGNTGTPASAPSPDDFWFANDSTIYLADSRVNGNGGIQKWTLSAGTWNFQYTLGLGQLFSVVGTPNTTAVGVHGLTGLIDGSGNAVLFATTFDNTGQNINQFFTVTDTGASSTLAFLGTSGTNTAFRGIEIAQLPPVSATPEPGSFLLIVMGLLAAVTRVRRRN